MKLTVTLGDQELFAGQVDECMCETTMAGTVELNAKGAPVERSDPELGAWLSTTYIDQIKTLA